VTTSRKQAEIARQEARGHGHCMMWMTEWHGIERNSQTKLFQHPLKIVMHISQHTTNIPQIRRLSSINPLLLLYERIHLFKQNLAALDDLHSVPGFELLLSCCLLD
jgi:hypothetical protein